MCPPALEKKQPLCLCALISESLLGVGCLTVVNDPEVIPFCALCRPPPVGWDWTGYILGIAQRLQSPTSPVLNYPPSAGRICLLDVQNRCFQRVRGPTPLYRLGDSWIYIIATLKPYRVLILIILLGRLGCVCLNSAGEGPPRVEWSCETTPIHLTHPTYPVLGFLKSQILNSLAEMSWARCNWQVPLQMESFACIDQRED